MLERSSLNPSYLHVAKLFVISDTSMQLPPNFQKLHLYCDAEYHDDCKEDVQVISLSTTRLVLTSFISKKKFRKTILFCFCYWQFSILGLTRKSSRNTIMNASLLVVTSGPILITTFLAKNPPFLGSIPAE